MNRQIKDESLLLVWDKLYQAIIDIVDADFIRDLGPVILDINENVHKKADSIRVWLKKCHTNRVLEKVIELSLDSCAISCFPQELSLFVGLKTLSLCGNKLTSVCIPETLHP